MAPSEVMRQVEEIWSYLVVRSGWSLRTSLYTTQQSSSPVPSSGASVPNAVLHSPSHLVSGAEPTMSESPPSNTKTNVGNPVTLTADGQHNLVAANSSPQCSANSSLNRSCSRPPSVSQPLSISQPGPVAHSTSKDSQFFGPGRCSSPSCGSSRVEGGGCTLNTPSLSMQSSINLQPTVHAELSAIQGSSTCDCIDLSSCSSLRLICLNVRGLLSNSDYVHQLLRDCDICAISEHWLHHYNLTKLYKEFSICGQLSSS